MRLAESSNTEVSGASEVPQSRGKLFFKEVQLLCFLLENRYRSSKFVSIEIDRNTEVQAITSTIDRFITKFFKLVFTN